MGWIDGRHRFTNYIHRLAPQHLDTRVLQTSGMCPSHFNRAHLSHCLANNESVASGFHSGSNVPFLNSLKGVNNVAASQHHQRLCRDKNRAKIISFPLNSVHGIDHGNDIVHWRLRLHIMNGIENKSSAWREYFTSAENLLTDFSRIPKRKDFLRINSSPPENEAVPKVCFQLRRLHASCGTLALG